MHWTDNNCPPVHLNKMLATEIQGSGLKIRVNAIAPGVFPSEMTTQDSSDENQKSEMPKDKKGSLPSGRPGRDVDMAAGILFVVCCQYLNGQKYVVLPPSFSLTCGEVGVWLF